MSREQIQRHVTTYREKLAEIRADKTLSPLGKRRAIENLHRTTKAVVDPLRADLAQHQTTSRRELERRLFGLPRGADPSTVIAYRDAQDRVAGVKSADELGELMERAATTGDDTLLRAAAGHAWSKSCGALASEHWGLLVDEYARQTPNTQHDYEQFVEATRPAGATQAFAEQLSMSLHEPEELRVPEDRLSDAAPPKAEQAVGLFRGP